MSDTQEQINWGVFTVDERQAIELALRQGRYEDIGACLVIDEPIREAQIQLIKQQNVPLMQIDESKVQAAILEAETKSGGMPTIDTPEKEAAWQAQIDAEKASQNAAAANGQSPYLAPVDPVVVPADVPESDPVPVAPVAEPVVPDVAPVPVEAPAIDPVDAPVAPVDAPVDPAASVTPDASVSPDVAPVETSVDATADDSTDATGEVGASKPKIGRPKKK